MNLSPCNSARYILASLTFLTAACAAPQPAASPERAAPPPRPVQASPSRAPEAPAATPVEVEARTLAGGLCADTIAADASEIGDGGAGYLDPKVVQNVVQGGYFSMRECYEAGLARDTELTGKIQVRFVIDQDGRVSSARLDDNTLPDCEAARCMLEVYRGLEFPEPDGGRVTVVYPLTFTPG